MSRDPRPSPSRPSPARKASPASIRSPGAIFLSFAARNFDEARRVDEAGREDPDQRWRATEHRLAAFLFACSALEAHVVGVHQCFFGQGRTPRELRTWRARSLEARVKELLPKRSWSVRRRRLLADVVQLRRRAEQPPPFQVAEQIELFGPAEPPAHGAFWFGPDRGGWFKVAPRRDEDDEHQPAGLPDDPLDLDERQLTTALLVVLEHTVLLDRHFQGWSEWPLSARVGGRTVTAAEWFDALRAGYEGPHAAYFRRVRADLDEGGADE